jgi:hypothetical protein
MNARKTKPKDLLPVPWDKIEPHYRAGLRSQNSIAKQFGVTRRAMEKHALKHGWQRDLAPAIHDRADQLVARAVATRRKQVAPKTVATKALATKPATAPSVTDAEIVDAGGEQLALVKLEHRGDIAALRKIIAGLMRELGAVMDYPEKFAQAFDVLANLEEPALGVLADMATVVGSLPARTKVAKDLADALHRCIGMEREAFGLNTAGGTDGLPMVILKDYTGKGDPDSPYFGKPPPDEDY